MEEYINKKNKHISELKDIKKFINTIITNIKANKYKPSINRKLLNLTFLYYRNHKNEEDDDEDEEEEEEEEEEDNKDEEEEDNKDEEDEEQVEEDTEDNDKERDEDSDEDIQFDEDSSNNNTSDEEDGMKQSIYFKYDENIENLLNNNIDTNKYYYSKNNRLDNLYKLYSTY
jgi:hypothetical protein